MKRVLVIFGTRPEAIKMCPVVKELYGCDGLEVAVCVTGQHREMLDGVLDEFGITPDFRFEAMSEGQSLASLLICLVDNTDKVLGLYRPDLVLVHGDTSSAYAASLAAFYRRIPIAHVEAGLRTNDICSPFPEELNRRAISLMSAIDFAPTQNAAQRLISEGKSRVYVTGNTVIDAFAYTLRDEYTHRILEFAAGKRLLLLTSHRRENIGKPMERIFNAVKRIVREHSDVCAVYPMHKNPAVRGIAHRCLSGEDRIMLTDALGVTDMHNIMARSYAVVTDSGGLQEEAPHLGIPVLVTRDSTERSEGVESGGIKLVGTLEEGVYDGIKSILCDAAEYKRMSGALSPYGDGSASRTIAQIISAI